MRPNMRIYDTSCFLLKYKVLVARKGHGMGDIHYLL